MKTILDNNMNRRSLLQLSAALGSTAFFPDFIAGTQAKQVANSDGVEIMTLSDGNLRLPLSFIFPEVPKEELQKLLSEILVEGEYVEPGLNLTLMRNDNRVVLFDVGSGSNFMPSAGKLADSLDAAGISADEITDVVFTHAHPDHLWGILDDFDEVLFSEATLHVPRKEFEFWSNDATVDLMPDARKPFAVGAKSRLEVMDEQIKLFEVGAEVLPKIEAVDTSGHTPGHTSFVIHAANEPVMVLGDALTNHIISFEKPEWPSGSDQDPEQGIKTRKMLLDRLAADKIQIVGYHLPNEGVGRVEKSENSYRFITS